MVLFEKGVNDLIWEDSSTLDRWRSSMVDTVEFLRGTNRETNESRPGDCLPERNTYCNSGSVILSEDLKNASQEKAQFSIVSSPLLCYCVLCNIST